MIDPKRDAASYPERHGFREQCPEWCRKPVPLKQMWTITESTVNEKLKKAGHSLMIKEEVAGGRLCALRDFDRDFDLKASHERFTV